MAKIQRRPEILSESTSFCRLPVRDRAVRFLFVSSWLGPMESETRRVGRIGMRPGSDSG